MLFGIAQAIAHLHSLGFSNHFVGSKSVLLDQRGRPLLNPFVIYTQDSHSSNDFSAFADFYAELMETPPSNEFVSSWTSEQPPDFQTIATWLLPSPKSHFAFTEYAKEIKDLEGMKLPPSDVQLDLMQVYTFLNKIESAQIDDI
jgi:hypothetical protein